MIQALKDLWDIPVAVGSIASPLWLKLFDDGAHVFFVSGGAILLIFRLVSAYRSWKRGR